MLPLLLKTKQSSLPPTHAKACSVPPWWGTWIFPCLNGPKEWRIFQLCWKRLKHSWLSRIPRYRVRASIFMTETGRSLSKETIPGPHGHFLATHYYPASKCCTLAWWWMTGCPRGNGLYW